MEPDHPNTANQRPLPDRSSAEATVSSDGRYVSPWLYIITLYFPFGMLQSGLGLHLPNNLLKLLEFSNEQIGMLSGLGIIASARFIFAPWLDGVTTKRKLSIITLFLAGTTALAMGALTISQPDGNILFWGMALLLLMVAAVGACHETAADGYYIRALDPKLQAQFIGIKTASIRVGIISAGTGLLLFATKISEHYGATDITSVDKTGFYYGFSSAFALAGISMLAIAVYNLFMVPKIPEDQPVRHERFALLEVIRDYLKQDKIVLIIAFLLIYRFGEGFLVMKYPFYLDARDQGGLGSNASDLAYLSLLGEMPWMIIGGVFGGYIIKWFGLRRVFMPLALCISIPNLFFFWLASTQPTATFPFLGQNINTALLFSSSIEALGYGMSFSAMFYYMHILATESGRNKTSILAISFAIMNVGWFLPGMLSGFLQAAVGYTGLFLLSSLVGLLALFFIPKLPMPISERETS